MFFVDPFAEVLTVADAGVPKVKIVGQLAKISISGQLAKDFSCYFQAQCLLRGVGQTHIMGAVVGVVGGQKLGIVIEVGGQLHTSRSETPGYSRVHIGLPDVGGVKLINDLYLFFKVLVFSKRKVVFVDMRQEIAL